MSKGFLTIIRASLALSLLVVGVIGCINYLKIQEEHQTSLQHKLLYLEKNILKLLDKSHMALLYFGKKIAQNPGDLENVQKLLKNSHEIEERENFWDSILWINEKSEIIATSKQGLLASPVLSKRSFNENCVKYPWKVFIEGPIESLFIKGHLILPIAMGVTRNGRYVGRIGTTIPLSQFTKLISSIETLDDIDFLVTDINETPIIEFSQGKPVLNNKTTTLSSFDYSLSKQVTGEPVNIYIRSPSQTGLWQVLPRMGTEIALLILLLSVYGLLLLAYKRNVLIPLSELSNHALKCLNKEGGKKEPFHQSQELKEISNTLNTLVNYATQERSFKQELEEKHLSLEKSYQNTAQEKASLTKKLSTLEISKKAREKIRQEVFHRVLESMNHTTSWLKELRRYADNLAAYDDKFVSLIQNLSRTSSPFDPEEIEELHWKKLHMNDILRESIELHVAHAEQAHVCIQSTLNANVPELSGDRIFLIQAFSGLISLSLKGSPKNTTILLTSSFHEEAETPFIQITLEDKSFDLSLEQLELLCEKSMNSEEMMEDPLNPSLPTIQKIIQLHGGTYHVVPGKSGGKCIFIKIPLTKNQRKDTPSSQSKENVYKFRRRSH